MLCLFLTDFSGFRHYYFLISLYQLHFGIEIDNFLAILEVELPEICPLL